MFVHISRSKRDGAILAEHPEFVHLTQTGSTKTYFHHVRSLLRGRFFSLTPFAEMGRAWSEDRRDLLCDHCRREEGF